MQNDKKNERFLLTAVFLFWFSTYTYPSFLSAYVTGTLGATKVMAGMIVGSYGLTQMLLRVPLGILSDMLKKRKIFVMMGFALSIVSSGGLTVVALLAGRDHVPAGLAYAVLVLRGTAGMMAATWVNLSVLCAASYTSDQAASAMSRIVVPQCGSQITAMLIGSQLAGRLGEIWAFLLAMVSGIVGMLIMSRVKEQTPQGEPLTLRGVLGVARNPQLLLGTALATLYQLVVWTTVQGFVQNWARDVLGATTTQLGLLSVVNLLPNMVLSRFSGTVWAVRHGRRKVLVLGFILMAAACFLYPRTGSLAALLAVQALLGAGVGLIMPLTMASAIETVPATEQGAAMGIYQAVYGLGMFLGPVLGGLIIERFADPVRGYAANFYAAMGIAVVGGLLAWIYDRNRMS